ncbi:MAG: Asp23/Gls24 family envelope stress response protein [Gaiellaceae bacterium]
MTRAESATITGMEGHASISAEVLGSYAADAAREVDGVYGLVESPLGRHKGVRVTEGDNAVAVELHVAVDWGTDVPDAGRAVQRRVAEFLARMADVRPASIDVVVAEIRPPDGRA